MTFYSCAEFFREKEWDGERERHTSVIQTFYELLSANKIYYVLSSENVLNEQNILEKKERRERNKGPQHIQESSPVLLFGKCNVASVKQTRKTNIMKYHRNRATDRPPD